MKDNIIYKYIKLIRPQYLALVVLMQIATHLYISAMIKAEGGIPQMQALDVTLCVLATVMTMVGGFLVNDYFDVKIDKINRPLTMVVNKGIARDTVFSIYVGVTAVALLSAGWLSYRASSLNYFFIFVAVVGLLWFYSSGYKRSLVIGNLIFGICIALIPLTIALYDLWFAASRYGEVEGINELFMSMLGSVFQTFKVLFAWGVAFDILRGMEEENGEREMECRSIAIVLGHKVAKSVVSVFVILGMYFGLMFMLDLSVFVGEIAFRTVLFTIVPISLVLVYEIFKAEKRFDYILCYGMLGVMVVSMFGLLAYASYIAG